MQSNRVVISICDESGVMVDPWLQAGYQCWIVDFLHSSGVHRDGNLVRVGADITEIEMLLSLLPSFELWAIAFAFPPCTDLAGSGARHWKSKGFRAMVNALSVVAAARDIVDSAPCPWLLENPTSWGLRHYWREPDYKFDPWEYAGYNDDLEQDAYTKETWLWTGNGFKMPEPDPVWPVKGSFLHAIPPGPQRQRIRSRTPSGFAKAVFCANAGTSCKLIA